MSNKLNFVKFHDFKLYKSPLNSQQERFANISALVAYQKKAFRSLIFDTNSMIVAKDTLEPFRIPITLTKKIERGREVNTRLGSLPLSYKDLVTDIFRFK